MKAVINDNINAYIDPSWCAITNQNNCPVNDYFAIMTKQKTVPIFKKRNGFGGTYLW